MDEDVPVGSKRVGLGGEVKHGFRIDWVGAPAGLDQALIDDRFDLIGEGEVEVGQVAVEPVAGDQELSLATFQVKPVG